MELRKTEFQKNTYAQVPCRSFLTNRFFELDFARATTESVVPWAHHWQMQVTKQQLLVGSKILVGFCS